MEGECEVSGVVVVQAVVQATGLIDGIALFSSGFELREVGSNPTAATPKPSENKTFYQVKFSEGSSFSALSRELSNQLVTRNGRQADGFENVAPPSLHLPV